MAVCPSFATSLFSKSYPRSTSVITNLASSIPSTWDISGTNHSIEVSLAQGHVWSDGVAMTAADIVYTYEMVRRLQSSMSGITTMWALSSLIDVVAVDDYTVRYVFNAAQGIATWQHGVGMAPIVPKHFWSLHDTNTTTLFEEELAWNAPSSSVFRLNRQLSRYSLH